MRNLLIFLVLFSFINLSFIGCSSKDSVKEEGEIQTSLEEIDQEEGEDVSEEEGDGEEAEDYDEVAEGDEEDEDMADSDDTEEQDSEEVANSDSSDEESPSALAEIESDVESDIVEDNSGLSEVTGEPQDEVAFEEETEEIVEESPVRKWIPVKKVKTEPFSRGNLLANGIYIVRDGDSLGSISEKIYGSDRSEDILTINPHFRGKGVKIGDKVYYNSPLRPDDSGQIMNFYEERGLAPQVYVSQAGDNIRQVSKKLLGHSRSWMEIYAINSVDSKGELEPGVELRYWSDSVLDAPSMAETSPAEEIPSEVPQEVVAQEEQVSIPEPAVVQEPVQEVAEVPSGDIPPPPSEELPQVPAEPEIAINNNPPPIEPPPTLESDPVEELPPPPPVDLQESKVVQEEGSLLEGLPLDEDMLFSIGGGIVVLLGLILFIVRRRKASQMAAFEDAIFDEEISEDVDEDIEKTHVGH